MRRSQLRVENRVTQLKIKKNYASSPSASPCALHKEIILALGVTEWCVLYVLSCYNLFILGRGREEVVVSHYHDRASLEEHTIYLAQLSWRLSRVQV